jgi:hypothetical protein
VSTHYQGPGQLTRAREQTHIYAADAARMSPDADRLERLAERVSQSEPEVPSINTPLSHEAAITKTFDLTRPDESPRRVESSGAKAQEAELLGQEITRAAELAESARTRPSSRSNADEIAVAPRAETIPLMDGAEHAQAPEHDQTNDEKPRREWPNERELDSPRLSATRLDRDETRGWEP